MSPNNENLPLMPNNYTNIVTATLTRDEDGGCDPSTLKEWASDMLERVMPTPAAIRHRDPRYMSDAQVGWCVSQWGTRWDVYDVADPILLPGDCWAHLISFCTAWSPPSDKARALVIADAAARGITILSWVGIDPYDDTPTTLYARKPEPRR